VKKKDSPVVAKASNGRSLVKESPFVGVVPRVGISGSAKQAGRN